MRYVQLGSSDLQVSEACLGTMTWGTQNDQQDAEQQLALALDRGINFIDTAELYSVPPTAETYGATETIIGKWLAQQPSKRQNIILASKIAGVGLPYIRNGSPISGDSVTQAINDSLQRLNTDYLDLYQLHWPNRTSPHFGKHWPEHIDFTSVNTDQHVEQMLDILRALDKAVKAGKVRYCGLSDDSPWGMNTYLRLAEEYDLPRMVSIQNEFSLLHTKDWPYLIENCVHEKVAYLPWSPLATGLLSGKYRGGKLPAGSRWTLTQRNGLFRNTPQVHAAVEDFYQLSEQLGMSLAQLALAWIKQVDGVSSTIIGATQLAQLEENIDAFDITLEQSILKTIAELLRKHPSPF